VLKLTIPENYFERETQKDPLFEKITDRVYAFRYGFNRALILDTDAGIAVVDSYNAKLSEALKKELDLHFPETPVQWLFYSHYHLDHVRGGRMLSPIEVVAHQKCLSYWEDLNSPDVLMPTQTIHGDRILQLGQLELQLLDLGLSHSDTLYAFYLPQQRVLFSPDVGFVKALPPFGLPDFYHYGYIRALNRLIELDFDEFIPSHLDRGSKADLIEFRDFMVEVRERVDMALAKQGYNMATSGKAIKEIFDEVYPALWERYGHWHGFNSMAFPLFLRQVGGVYLGH
jgi:glyoxylase-like metal-dependent hydrolase (beta-lactamase superfamily II)